MAVAGGRLVEGEAVRLARDVAKPGRTPVSDDRRKGFGHRAGRYACGNASRDRDRESAVKQYLVIYEEAEGGGWGAHSPDVDGVFALGRSRDEVERRMAEALADHLDLLRSQGDPLPEPHTHAGHIAG